MRKLTVDDGLSQNMVYSILQDRRGYMWFGTQDGLNRFDGHGFTIYKKDMGPGSVSSRGFFSMVETEDGRIWFGTTDGVNIYDPDRNVFETFAQTTICGEKVSGNVRVVRLDKEGNVWMGCQDGRLFRYGKSGLGVYDLAKMAGTRNPMNIRDLSIGGDGYVYIATYGSGVLALDTRSCSVSVHLFSNSCSCDANALYYMNPTSILVGTSSDGLLLLNPNTGIFSPFLSEDSSGQRLFVRSLMCCSERKVWIGTETGLYIYDTRTTEVSRMEYSASDAYSLSDNAIFAIYEDREDGIWVGTYFGGVNYITKSSVFEKYYPIPGKNSIGGRCVSEFAQCDEENIWVGTEDAGLYTFNPRKRNFAKVSLDAKNIHALMHDDSEVWVGTFTKGLYLMDSRTKRIKKRYTVAAGNLGSNSVYSLFKDSYGRIWAGAVPGLYLYDRTRDVFVPMRQEDLNENVNDIVEDYRGLLWFGTYGDGVWTYDTPRDKWSRCPFFINSEERYDTKVNCLVADREGRVWAGTDGDGLCLYDKEEEVFKVEFNSSSGLLNDVIYALECDRLGNIWGSTNKGLFRIDVKTMTVATYTHESGLLCDQFNYKSGFADDNGTMYFGSIKGFVSFRPEEMTTISTAPRLFLNSLYINGNEVRVGDRDMPLLSRSIEDTDEIVIPHGVSVFSLGLNEINYAPSHNNVYYYMLEGWDKMWLTAGLPSKVTYSNLPAGSYLFRVRASRDGEAEDAVTVKITIEPPVWKTWWAYLIYVFLCVGVSVVLVCYVKRRMDMVKKEEEKAMEEEREKAIFKAKVDFFSNITHEIRTPLSLIRLPLEEIIAKTPQNNGQYKNMLIIRDNVDRLLNLVNQLLDFRKVNGDDSAVQFIHFDAVPVISKTLARFQPAATLKNISMDVILPDSLMVDAEEEMLIKMTSNLLSNALKHANQYIKVELSSRNSCLMLSVMNDGDVIPDSMREKIFNPYFKLNENTEGFGIGLPFARSLADFHKGHIRVAERDDDKTEFVLMLPLEQENAIRISSEVARPDVEADNQDDVPEIVHKKTILLVDNDTSFVNFMSDQLRSAYKVKKAYSGDKALEYLKTHYVDVVISDVKLPDISGIELCSILKNDVRYSNVPIILLTSEVSRESRVAGISAGADAFVEKPCYIDYLIACIENQFKNRYISEAAKSADDETASNMVFTKADDEFMNQLTGLIYNHLEEVDLDVNRLALMMNMSRATLYRRVKESLRVTPNDFIRIVRLHKAAELLRSGEYRINEIAYIVGFASSSYFSKCFRKQYGVLPKDFSKEK